MGSITKYQRLSHDYRGGPGDEARAWACLMHVVSFLDTSPSRPSEMKNREGKGLAEGVVCPCIRRICTMQSIDRFATVCGKVNPATRL